MSCYMFPAMLMLDATRPNNTAVILTITKRTRSCTMRTCMIHQSALSKSTAAASATATVRASRDVDMTAHLLPLPSLSSRHCSTRKNPAKNPTMANITTDMHCRTQFHSHACLRLSQITNKTTRCGTDPQLPTQLKIHDQFLEKTSPDTDSASNPTVYDSFTTITAARKRNLCVKTCVQSSRPPNQYMRNKRDSAPARS